MGCLSSKKKSDKNKSSQPELKMSLREEEKKIAKLYEIKIVLLGTQATGKSSLIIRYISDKFEDKYKVTIGGAYLQKDVKLKNGDNLKLHIWDTSGQERFRAITQLYYKDASAAILVYDITSKESLNDLEYWIKQLYENNDTENLIVACAGNKIDLEDRKVSYNEGKNFCKENKIPIFYETSAKTNIGIRELFQNLAQKVYEQQKKKLEE